MQFEIHEAIEILRRTPQVLLALLDGLTEPWIRNNYGPETFSPFDVLGHLIHGEKTDWIPRAKNILEYGESRAFDPFDRYAMFKDSQGKSIDELLDEFETLRRRNIEELRAMNLSEAQLNLRGTHPALGRVTMRELLATWVAHDLNHIAQVCKAMAFQYRDQVGPWLAYISVLRPPNPA